MNLSEFSEQLYEESEANFTKRIQKRLNGPPPVYNGDDLEVINLEQDDKKLRE